MSSRYDDLLAGLDGRKPSQPRPSSYDDLLDQLDEKPGVLRRFGRAVKHMVTHPIETAEGFVEGPERAKDALLAPRSDADVQKRIAELEAEIPRRRAASQATIKSMGLEKVGKAPPGIDRDAEALAGLEAEHAALTEDLHGKAPSVGRRAVSVAQLGTLALPFLRAPVAGAGIAAKALRVAKALEAPAAGAVWMPDDPAVGAMLGGTIPAVGKVAEVALGARTPRAAAAPPEGVPLGPARHDPRVVRLDEGSEPARRMGAAPGQKPFEPTEARLARGHVALLNTLETIRRETAPRLERESALLQALGDTFVKPREPAFPAASDVGETFSMQGVRDAPTASSGHEPIRKLGGRRREGATEPTPNTYDAIIQPYRDILENAKMLEPEAPREPALPTSPERLGATEGTVTTTGMENAPVASSRGPVLGKGTRLTQGEIDLRERLRPEDGPEAPRPTPIRAAAEPAVEPPTLKPVEEVPTTGPTAATKRGKGQPLFESHRTDSGRLRPVGSVTDDGLIRSLIDYGDKINDATARAQYANVDAESGGVFKRTVADTRGGGPSRQAKALQNLQDYERIRGNIYEELNRRGYTDEQIHDRWGKLVQLEESLARDAEANAPPRAFEEQTGPASDPTDFAFGANVEPTSPPAAPAAAAPRAPVGEQSGMFASSSAGGGTKPQVVREPASELTMNWKFFGGRDSPISRTLESRMEEAVTRERLLSAKGQESLPAQTARSEAFARKLREHFGDIDLTNVDGAEIGGMYRVLSENTAALESASRALESGKLTLEEAAQANRIITAASEQSGKLLQGIVRGKADIARSLGYQRELVHMSNAPEVHLVAAQRLAGDVPLSDKVMLEIRRLSKIAQEACGY